MAKGFISAIIDSAILKQQIIDLKKSYNTELINEYAKKYKDKYQPILEKHRNIGEIDDMMTCIDNYLKTHDIEDEEVVDDKDKMYKLEMYVHLYDSDVEDSLEYFKDKLNEVGDFSYKIGEINVRHVENHEDSIYNQINSPIEEFRELFENEDTNEGEEIYKFEFYCNVSNNYKGELTRFIEDMLNQISDVSINIGDIQEREIEEFTETVYNNNNCPIEEYRILFK
ncbi:hypothetical protein ACFL1H_05740 [Nanoarchaeota archaeon]